MYGEWVGLAVVSPCTWFYRDVNECFVSRQMDGFLLFFLPRGCSSRGAHGPARCFRQRPARLCKGCAQKHANNAFNDDKQKSQSIEQDCEHLQCLMSIYNRRNVSADTFLFTFFIYLGYAERLLFATELV